MRTPKNWSRVSLGHPKFGTRCPLGIWLGCQIYGLPQSCTQKTKDHNMEPVGLGNTRILTNYTQKSPRTVAVRWVCLKMDNGKSKGVRIF